MDGPKTVFVVMVCDHGEVARVAGVFSTIEKAEAKFDELKKMKWREISEATVDGEYEPRIIAI